MNTVVSLSLACLFVLLAGFNLWTMLAPPGAPGGKIRSMQAHRGAGYTFIALYAVMVYFMLLRIKGMADELSPRLAVHMGLALILAPVLVVKVFVARHRKAARGLLTGLGMAIFVSAFTLVALNASLHFLRAAAPGHIPFRNSAIVIAVVLGASAILFLRRPPVPKARVSAEILSTATPATPTQTNDWFSLKLVKVESQTATAKTLRFLVPEGQHITARPGQFLTFEWMIEGKRVFRSYSISSSPNQRSYLEITCKRVENGCVSCFLNDCVEPGLIVRARGPYGQFCFDEAAHKRIVLIAGGSGITPMMSVLRYIDDRCLPVDATLIYCVRTKADLFFRSELQVLGMRLPRFHFVPVLSQASSEWEGWQGRLRRGILEREVSRPSESTFFLCGPPEFMLLARNLLREMSVAASQILQESFGSAVPAARGVVPAETMPASEVSTSLRVTFARSAVTCNASPQRTLLESSEANGVLIPSGCRQGSCGTCATRILSGEVEMGGEEGLKRELRSKGYILPCVSRPLGDVVIDA